MKKMVSRMSRAVGVVCLLSVILPVFGLYDTGSPVKVINDQEFRDVARGEHDTLVLVEFFAPWCGHCKALAPSYEKVAQNLDGLAEVYAVDCDVSKEACASAAIGGFPTIKAYVSDGRLNPYTGQPMVTTHDYTGSRSTKSIIDLATSKMPNHVVPLTSENFDSAVPLSELPLVILFTDKEKTTPLYKGLSAQFKNRLQLAQVQSKDEALTSRFNVESFPTLIVIKDPKNPSQFEVYNGELKVKSLLEYLSKFAKPKTQGKKVSAFKELPIPASNFTETVMKSENAWIVHFESETPTADQWDDIRAQVNAMFSLGRVDCTGEAELKIAHKLKINSFPKFAAFPFGDDKDMNYKLFDDIAAAKQYLIDELPDATVFVTTSMVQAYFASSAQSNKLAALLLTDKSAPSATYKALALHPTIRDAFSFGFMSNPEEAVKQSFQITERLPALVVGIPTPEDPTKLSILKFDSRVHGPMSYPYLLGFFNMVKSNFKKTPAEDEGDSTDNEPESVVVSGDIPQATADTFESLCLKRAGLCAILFVDGDDSSEEAKERRESAISVMKKVQKDMTQPVNFVWVDGVCQADFTAAFGVQQTLMPTVAILAPNLKKHAQLVGAFQATEIKLFIDRAIRGRVGLGEFKDLPNLQSLDCNEIRKAQQFVPESTSEEEDEILREILEEAARKEREREEELKRLKEEKKAAKKAKKEKAKEKGKDKGKDKKKSEL